MKSDGSGSELLCDKQLAGYFREKRGVNERIVKKVFVNKNVKLFETEKLVGMETSKAIGFLTKAFTLKEQLESLDLMKDVEIPRIIDSLQESAVLKKEPSKELFKYRCLIVHPELDAQKREQFKKDFAEYRRWKENFENTKKRLIIQDTRTPAELAEEKRIQDMILSTRQPATPEAKAAQPRNSP